jgi:hypothetical protein
MDVDVVFSSDYCWKVEGAKCKNLEGSIKCMASFNF